MSAAVAVDDAVDDDCNHPTPSPSPAPAPSPAGISVTSLPRWRRWVVQWDISHLAVPLAFIAFTAMWKTASKYLPIESLAHSFYNILFYVSTVVLIVTLIPLLLRLLIFPGSIKHDFHHPRLMNFFFMPVMIGSLFIMSLPVTPSKGFYIGAFYILGTYQLGLALYMFGEWLFTSKQTLYPVEVIHPLMFMQTIGFFLTANIAVRGHLFEQAKGMLYVGVLFWLLVFISNFQHVSKSTPQQRYSSSPTFFLFLAPPAQAALTFVLLERTMLMVKAAEAGLPPKMEKIPWPQISQAFLYIDLFLYALVARVFLTLYTVKFSVAFWAYIFPLSAASALVMCKYFDTPTAFWKITAFIAGFVACLAMLVVFVSMTKSLLVGETPSNPAALQQYVKAVAAQRSKRWIRRRQWSRRRERTVKDDQFDIIDRQDNINHKCATVVVDVDDHDHDDHDEKRISHMKNVKTVTDSDRQTCATSNGDTTAVGPCHDNNNNNESHC